MRDKKEEAAFLALGDPPDGPDYMANAARLRRTLTPAQDAALLQVLEDFAAVVHSERRWFFHKGYLAGRKATASKVGR